MCGEAVTNPPLPAGTRSVARSAAREARPPKKKIDFSAVLLDVNLMLDCLIDDASFIVYCRLLVFVLLWADPASRGGHGEN
jgi:hypothetical protein